MHLSSRYQRQQQYNQRRSMMKAGEFLNQSNRVFFKDFIKMTEPASPDANRQPTQKRKLHKIQRSSIAIKRMLKEIQNSHKEKLKKREECSPGRLSVTREEKRSSTIEEHALNDDSTFIQRGVHRKPAEFVRSKQIGEAIQDYQSDCKYAKIVEFNKRFKERRENSLKMMANQTFSRSKDHEKIWRISNNIKSMTTELTKTSSMPLQEKYKSSKHFEMSRDLKTPFEVSESSESLQSNLLNPESSEKLLIKQEGSDSAKRFYLKLKKNKLGNLFGKPADKEFALLQNQRFSKEIPSQLGIYKILLPKRNHRHEFLQNIQKIKENYLRIKGHAQKQPEQNGFAEFKRRQGTTEDRRAKKTYEIKYRRMRSPISQDKLVRSKTEFFHNRSQWQAFVSAPFEPWETEETNKICI